MRRESSCWGLWQSTWLLALVVLLDEEVPHAFFGLAVLIILGRINHGHRAAQLHWHS